MCSVHTKLPALPGETLERWTRRAPIRARRAVIAENVFASIKDGADRTVTIAKIVGESDETVRRAIKALRDAARVERVGRGRAIRYKLAVGVAA
jgi:DNA-binding transcriptional ArsR family regulator